MKTYSTEQKRLREQKENNDARFKAWAVKYFHLIDRPSQNQMRTMAKQ